MLRINPININPNLTTFSVDDPSDNVTCMINKTTPHADMFILSLHGNGKCFMLIMVAKEQTKIYKTLHRKLIIEQHEPPKNLEIITCALKR